jgi:hypothetical protein
MPTLIMAFLSQVDLLGLHHHVPDLFDVDLIWWSGDLHCWSVDRECHFGTHGGVTRCLIMVSEVGTSNSMGPVEKCMRDGGIDKHRVHEVVIMDASTHIPKGAGDD